LLRRAQRRAVLLRKLLHDGEVVAQRLPLTLDLLQVRGVRLCRGGDWRLVDLDHDLGSFARSFVRRV
jgi:hypothetical protein